jgi:pimeloyl-ACP methyl ester carboxylesterase
VATHADDLARVTAAVRAAGSPRAGAPVHVAFSMGVTVLLEMYRRRPEDVRAMVLVAGGADHPYASSALFRVPGAARAIGALLAAVAPVVPRSAPLVRRMTGSPAAFALARATNAIGPRAPRAEVEYMIREVGAMDLEAYWSSLRSLMRAHASDVARRVAVPVLVVAPERDVMALRKDVTALGEAIAGAEVMEVPGTSHAVLLEAGEAIGARVRQFLTRV